MRRALCRIAIVLILLALPLWAQDHCQQVSGVLMTNIGTMPLGPISGTNLGPVFGDLAGSVAATQINDSPIQFQHYWVTTGGDTIEFKPATLIPAPTDDPYVVAVRWGNYRSDIAGGTGRFKKAKGYLDYFGLADFAAKTLVLRYRGEVCFANPASTAK